MTSVRDITDIYLLNILPYPDSRPSGWDRGFELIPAGQLAVEQINNRSDIFPDYRLNLINIGSEPCGIRLITDGLVNFFRPFVDPDVLSVGVIGLFCSSLTDTIAPLVDHPGIDYIQIAASASPVHRNPTEYPRLFHTTSSSNVFNEAVMELMETFDWRLVNVIHDSLDIYFTTTAQDFIHRLKSSNDLLTQTAISIPTDISIAIDNLRSEGGRIVYGSVTIPQAAKIMCEAHKRGFVWPAYAYIFHEHSLEELIEEVMEKPADISCNVREITEASEGIFSLQFKLEIDNETVLESGLTYGNYKELYLQRLADFASQSNMNLTDNSYANVMYDQVWAFALALNGSVKVLDSRNLTLDRYRFGHATVSDIIQEKLANLSFQGASGLMQFNHNKESRTSVDVFQVQNGKSVHVATYFPYEDKLRLIANILPEVTEVKDTFGVVYHLVDSGFAVVIFVICGITFVVTTVTLVMLIYWRKQPEIKASSPFLSLTVFAACYLLIVAVIVKTLNRYTVIENTKIIDVNCNIEVWFGELGVNMIFATIFVKMMRIFYIFNQFAKTSKYWRDQYLFIGILALISPQLLLLILWTATDYVTIRSQYVISDLMTHLTMKLGLLVIVSMVWFG